MAQDVKKGTFYRSEGEGLLGFSELGSVGDKAQALE